MLRDRVTIRRTFEVRDNRTGQIIARTRRDLTLREALGLVLHGRIAEARRGWHNRNLVNTQGRLALQKALTDGAPLYDWNYGVVSSSTVEPVAADTAIDLQLGTGVAWVMTYPDDVTCISTATYSATLGTGTWGKAGSSHGIDGTGLIAAQLFDIPIEKTSGDNWDLQHRFELVW
jgi:hypothetical protein